MVTTTPILSFGVKLVLAVPMAKPPSNAVTISKDLRLFITCFFRIYNSKTAVNNKGLIKKEAVGLPFVYLIETYFNYLFDAAEFPVTGVF